MEDYALKLEILSPQKVLFDGEARLVRLPGAKAPFTVLHNHASILTVLERGIVRWENAGGESQLAIAGGFAKVEDNHVILCVETDG